MTTDKKTALKIVKHEKRVLKAEMKALNREYRWFMKQKDGVTKKWEPLKARRAELSGKK